ncbi:hypothetical protein AB0M54_27720 [Actinoplanes sp. NPDC051470]|uniref:hypothetical protein n=1 Tax=unclassified Actinoplanes TaxID=2626549 RepID=UPI00342D212E
MSLLQELGAQLRATSDELPTGLVTAAMEKLRSATELLNWVRQTSVDPIGVPQLGNATEHAEHAAAALRLAQDAIASYLAQVGLSGESQGGDAGRDWRSGLDRDEEKDKVAPPPGDEDKQPPPERLGPWWQRRVEQLTNEAPGEADNTDGRIGTTDLLRRVAGRVRAGDRASLGRDLHGVNAATGLSLSAAAGPVLRRLAGDLLGHEPRPDDVSRLRTAVSGRVRSLLPGISPAALDAVISRTCRAKSPDGDQPHPADSAVASSVVAGVLLARLGRDASTLDPTAPEPLPRRPEERPMNGADA